MLQCLAQMVADARDPGLDGANVDAEDVGGLLLTELAENPQRKRRAQRLRYVKQRPVDAAAQDGGSVTAGLVSQLDLPLAA